MRSEQINTLKCSNRMHAIKAILLYIKSKLCLKFYLSEVKNNQTNKNFKNEKDFTG